MILFLLLLFNICDFAFALYLIGSMFYESYQYNHLLNSEKKEGE